MRAHYQAPPPEALRIAPCDAQARQLDLQHASAQVVKFEGESTSHGGSAAASCQVPNCAPAAGPSTNRRDAFLSCLPQPQMHLSPFADMPLATSRELAPQSRAAGELMWLHLGQPSAEPPCSASSRAFNPGHLVQHPTFLASRSHTMPQMTLDQLLIV